MQATYGTPAGVNEDGILRNAHMHVGTSTPERVHSPISAHYTSIGSNTGHFNGSGVTSIKFGGLGEYARVSSENAATPTSGSMCIMTSPPVYDSSVYSANIYAPANSQAFVSARNGRRCSGEIIKRYQNSAFETTSMYDVDAMDTFDEQSAAPPFGSGGDSNRLYGQNYRMLRRASSSLLM